uniref:Major facilitator superfamily (MFS) profile domain-containing protein n=1 Tax=Minutocellus polymorphus TaxID=265543 RepID=A0A7S0B0Z6_9STRA
MARRKGRGMSMKMSCQRCTKFIFVLLLQSALSASPTIAVSSASTLTPLPQIRRGSSKSDAFLDRSSAKVSNAFLRKVADIRSGAIESADKRLSQCARQRLTVLLVATALFNDMLQLTMLLPIIHTLVTSPPPLGVEGNSELALGIFFASKDICQMAMAPVAGILTSKTSPNVALLLSTVGLGLATAVFAEATTFWQLLLARGAQGAASAAVMCGGMSLIAETHSANNRGSAIGLAQTGLAGGLLCGPLIGGLLFERLGRRNTFRLAAVIVLMNALAQLVLMSFAPPERHIAADAKGGGQDQKKGGKMTLLASSRSLLTNRDILGVASSTFAIHAVVGVIKPLSQVVLDREFGVSMVHRSLIISIATVTYFMSTPISGWVSDHMSRPHLVALSLGLMALSAVFFALRTCFGMWAFNICVGLLGTSMGVAGSSSQSLLADLVDRNNIGSYSMAYALSDVADSLGLIVGPIVGLFLSQRFGPSSGVLSVGALCVFLTPVMLRIKP